MRQLFSVLSPQGRRARLTTLIFHRVLPEPDTMFPDEMHARRFDEICSWLARWFNTLPLDEAVHRLRARTLPARALAITFDDGYRDNHDVAMPILRRHGLSATFFVATGFLDGGRMFNDSVIESIRQAPGPTLDLRSVPGADLQVYPLRDIADRIAAVDAILERVKYLTPAQRPAVVQEIAARAGASLPDDLMMSSTQVRAMHAGGMQIGAHTVNHPILATLDEAEMRKEMLASKLTLEHIVGQPVTMFAYPNGKPGRDYGPAAVQAARDLGFVGAVSTARGAATVESSPYELPRFTPWDRTALKFGARCATTLLGRRPTAS